MRYTRALPAALCVLASLGSAIGAPQGAPGPLRLDLGSGVSMDLILVKAGAFRQGSPDREPGRADDETLRDVTLTHDFYMGRTEVTVDQFRRFVEQTGYKTESEKGTSGGFGWNGRALEQKPSFNWQNPGFPQEGDHPVTIVTFDDAQAFARWLSGKAGRVVSLPTEAQWEFAARGGSSSPYPSAADKVNEPTALGWSKANAAGQTHPVGEKLPNRLGLVDMAGNVAEWCLDWYGPYVAGPVTDPIEMRATLSDKPRRVLRGGSWLREAINGRSAARHRNAAGARNADNGFRIVAAVDASPPAAATPAAAPTSAAAETDGIGGLILAALVGALSWLFSFVVGVSLKLVLPVVVLLWIFFEILSRFGLVSGPLGVHASAGPDGFTLKAPRVPVGHRIHFKYEVNGVTKSGDVVSQGDTPMGQMVYTGSKPTGIRITAVTAPGERLPADTPKPKRASAPNRSITETRNDDDVFRGYPSAY